MPVRLEDSHGNIEQIKVVVQFNEKRLSKNSCPKISKKALCDFTLQGYFEKSNKLPF